LHGDCHAQSRHLAWSSAVPTMPERATDDSESQASRQTLEIVG